jgi:hypothetical protein
MIEKSNPEILLLKIAFRGFTKLAAVNKTIVSQSPSLHTEACAGMSQITKSLMRDGCGLLTES